MGFKGLGDHGVEMGICPGIWEWKELLVLRSTKHSLWDDYSRDSIGGIQG